MNIANLERLVKELESGKYEHGIGQLRSQDNKFCCLGVVCDIWNSRGWVRVNNGYFNIFEGRSNSGSLQPSLEYYVLGTKNWTIVLPFRCHFLKNLHVTDIISINDSYTAPHFKPVIFVLRALISHLKGNTIESLVIPEELFQ